MMRYILRGAPVLLVLAASFSAAGEEAAEKKTPASRTNPAAPTTVLRGDTLMINGNATKLGAAQWVEPEKNWRTVGELFKSTLPPADAAGRRPGVVPEITLDASASWGALKTLLMAFSALGIEQIRVVLPEPARRPARPTRPGQTGRTKRTKKVERPGQTVLLPLPGADPRHGTVVDLPLSADDAGRATTTNAGRRLRCTPALLRGLVRQQPRATVNVRASTRLPAYIVVKVLDGLRAAGAAGTAFLPVRRIRKRETAERKKVKDAVNRAFDGGLGGLGK